MNPIAQLFDTAGFMPRWLCGEWTPLHGWIHILSDAAISGAYFAIPLAMAYFLYKKGDVAFPRIGWLFAAFILSCGLGHLVEASLFWTPWYRLSAAVKLCTAVVSWVTVVALLRIVPVALHLPATTKLNEQLRAEIEERKRVEAQLRASEEQFRRVVDAAPNAMVMVGPRGAIKLVNTQAEQLFGYARAELLDQPMELLVPERFRAAHPGHRAGFMRDPRARSMGAGRDLTGLRKDGSEVPIEIGLNPIETPEGVFVLAAIIDITARKRAENALKAHLKEKEVLLQEIHHRVKNNLQVVSSLIGLQADTVQNPEARKALEDSRNRMQAIARVHEHLYQSGDLASLDFTTYLRELASSVFHLYLPTQGSRIQLAFAVEDVRLDINQAIPAALIVNELLVNALKYAFPGERAGLITLTLQPAPDGRLRLAVGDDGVGLPPGFDWRASSSLGLELVQTLTRQLRAELAVETSAGTLFALTFPLATTQPTKTV